MSNKRFKPTIRRELILRAAIESARQPGGWGLITRQVIANAAGCSEGLVSRYLGDMKDARRIIMKAAIKDEIVEIIVQSIVAHDGYAVKKWLPEALKQRAISSLLG
jgi:hypothetical protein